MEINVGAKEVFSYPVKFFVALEPYEEIYQPPNFQSWR